MNNESLTLGSLFDGSAGFPLAGILSGVTPVWASEVEPFAIRVTTKRMPFMKHYGDIQKMDGAKIEPVDIVTFGSPCQDLSVAGKRAGIHDGTRSSLFFEAVRIIKEMRRSTNGEYPKYIVWENVPGALSSGQPKGEDFRCVLEHICGIAGEAVSVPQCEKWENAGEILGNGFSVAWRVLDAQYWGVPQRRKRIYLVADLAGGRAGSILFESEGVSGYSAEGFRAWQRAAGGAAQSTGAAGVFCLNTQGHSGVDLTFERTDALVAQSHGNEPCVAQAAGFCTEHSAKARSVGYEEEKSPTLRAGVVPAALSLDHNPSDGRLKIIEDEVSQTLTGRMGTGGNNVPLLLKIRCGCEGGGKGPLIQTDLSATLSTGNDQTLFEPVQERTGALQASGYEKLGTQEAANGMYVVQPKAYGISSKDSNAMKSDNPHSGIYEAETTRTLDANGGNPSCNQGGMAIVGGIAFTQNQRDEVRDLGEKSGALCTQHGTKQQTFVIEGNGTRPSHKGEGYAEADVSYTLNATEQHGVAYAMTTGCFTGIGEDVAPTVMSRDYKDPAVVARPAYGIGRDAYNQGANAQFKPSVEEDLQPTLTAKGPGAVSYGFDPQRKAEATGLEENVSATVLNGTNPGYHNGVVESGYTVRRLTPTECARLQGFPDWWCRDLGTDAPSEADMAFWREVFETHRRIAGTASKPKTDNQIVKWLKDPHTDAAEYRLWGNGIALPCAYFVLSGIVWADAQITV